MAKYYKMKEACEILGMSYETLKFYCKEGLVPNVYRDKNNYRVFDERNIAWLQGVQCLRNCGMSMKDMKQYMEYCLQGPSSIPERKEMLKITRQELLAKRKDLDDALAYIDYKEEFYNGVLSGKIEYRSNLIAVENEEVCS